MPLARSLKVCLGKSETTSSHTVPACEKTTAIRALESVAFGVSARENRFQVVVRPDTVPWA